MDLDFSLLFFPPAPMGGSALPSGRRSSTVRKQVTIISLSNKAVGCVYGRTEGKQALFILPPSLT